MRGLKISIVQWVACTMAALSAAFGVSIAQSAPIPNDSVVRLVVSGEAESGVLCTKEGTGFFVDSTGIILTAAHLFTENHPTDCVNGSSELMGQINIEVFSDRERKLGRATALNGDNRFLKHHVADAALVRLNSVPRGYNVSPVRLCVLDKPSENVRLTMYGYADGALVPFVTPDGVTQGGFDELGRIQVTNTSAFPGMSGGPAVNNNGQAFGIVSTRHSTEPIIYLSPIGQIRDYLSRAGLDDVPPCNAELDRFFESLGLSADGAKITRDDSYMRAGLAGQSEWDGKKIVVGAGSFAFDLDWQSESEDSVHVVKGSKIRTLIPISSDTSLVPSEIPYTSESGSLVRMFLETDFNQSELVVEMNDWFIALTKTNHFGVFQPIASSPKSAEANTGFTIFRYWLVKKPKTLAFGHVEFADLEPQEETQLPLQSPEGEEATGEGDD